LGPIRYLTGLNTARQILWSYLLWYLVVLVRYFDPSPRVWLTSIGLSGIVGFALYLSTAGTSHATRLEKWQLFRLFLMPFCVSSFAALVKDHGFILIFSPRWQDLAWGAGLVVGFLVLVRVLKRPLRRKASGPPVGFEPEICKREEYSLSG
jgi:hypothetical protein